MTVVVEAALLHRRAEHVAPVAARDEVAGGGRAPAHDALEQAGARRIAQAQDLALDRTQRDARQPLDRAAPGAGRDDDPRGTDDLSAGQPYAAHEAAAALDRVDDRARAQRDAGAARRLGEREHERARIGRVVARDLECEPQRRREPRFEPPRGARQQTLDLEAESDAQRELALERLGFVAVASDDERAAAR